MQKGDAPGSNWWKYVKQYPDDKQGPFGFQLSTSKVCGVICAEFREKK